MAHAIWSGSINFGLVTIPVKLMTAVRTNERRGPRTRRRPARGVGHDEPVIRRRQAGRPDRVTVRSVGPVIVLLALVALAAWCLSGEAELRDLRPQAELGDEGMAQRHDTAGRRLFLLFSATAGRLAVLT